jgi:hypothetical protein
MTLRAVPSKATFRIDDGPTLSNAHTTTVPADGKEHVVSVSAKGYKTKNLHVVFDKDIIFDVSLDKLPTRSSPRHVRPPPPRATERKPGRLDTTDPWK